MYLLSMQIVGNIQFTSKRVEKIYNKAWRDEQIPRDWQVSLIVPVYKKGDIKECSNYR